MHPIDALLDLNFLVDAELYQIRINICSIELVFSDDISINLEHRASVSFNDDEYYEVLATEPSSAIILTRFLRKIVDKVEVTDVAAIKFGKSGTLYLKSFQREFEDFTITSKSGIFVY